jgi:hypothetical protein
MISENTMPKYNVGRTESNYKRIKIPFIVEENTDYAQEVKLNVIYKPFLYIYKKRLLNY